MHRYTLFICLLALAGCVNGSEDDGLLIPLKDVVASPIPDYYQSPSKIIRRRDFIRSDDEVSEDFLNQVVRNRSYRPAANVVLNGDSLQISISTIGVDGEQRPGSLDQIYLNAWGDILSPQAVNDGIKNFGIIGPQTILKINRRTYLLNMLNESRSYIRISELEDARDLPVTASINTRYKKLSVLDTEDEPTRIAREKDKRLIVLFMRFPEGSEDILAVHKAFGQLSAAERSRTQVAVVNRNTRAPADLKAFFQANEITFPLYLEGPGTCANFPCHDRFPYFLKVNSAGRITEYYGWLEELGW